MGGAARFSTSWPGYWVGRAYEAKRGSETGKSTGAELERRETALTDDDQGGALVKKDGALAGALVSAAVGVAVYRLRKALAEGGGLSVPRREEGLRDEGDHAHGGSALVAVWESASDSLLPLAEDAAEAAGKWVAEHSPAVIRDRLVPRFVESFTRARR